MAGLPRLVVLLLLAIAVPVAQPTPYSDNLQETCNKTLFPKVCIQSLTTNPESRTADARRLAELSVYVAKEVGTTVAAFAHHELTGVKEDTLFKCLDGCSDDIEETVAHLSALTREPTCAKFLEIKSWLSATLGGSNTCEETCKDAPISDVKNAVVTKSLEFEKLLRVTLDLITEASGSMPAAGGAVAPTAWEGSTSGSYGASAPDSYGASASGSYGSSASGSYSSSAPESSDSASALGSSGSSASGSYGSSASASEAASSDASAPSSAPTSEASSADAPSSYGSSASGSEAPSGDASAPSNAQTSDSPSADAPASSYAAEMAEIRPKSIFCGRKSKHSSYGAASAPAADAPSSSPSDADAPSSGAADSPSSGASYGSAGAPSPSGSGASAPEADSTA
ncbi:cell wall protein AWA1-like [Triticum aestivum]|uniref:cell wall protein AWA1-like n=1 Tax=Triticum aestivum TaxID=4565 RepID=UPI001D00820C|nr:cell wall protein AWA1-like [Triticum aestivum]